MIEEIRIMRKKNGVLIHVHHFQGRGENYVARFAPLDDYARKDGKGLCSTISDITGVLKPLLEQMDREYVEENATKEEVATA